MFGQYSTCAYSTCVQMTVNEFKVKILFMSFLLTSIVLVVVVVVVVAILHPFCCQLEDCKLSRSMTDRNVIEERLCKRLLQAVVKRSGIDCLVPESYPQKLKQKHSISQYNRKTHSNVHQYSMLQGFQFPGLGSTGRFQDGTGHLRLSAVMTHDLAKIK